MTQEMENCIPDTYRDLEADGRELGRILDAFLRTLTPENQMVFLRRYWYAESISQIAERYSLKENTVKSILFRTREQLRKFLQKEGVAV